MNEVSSRSHAIFTIHITVTFTTKLSHGGDGREDGAVDADGGAAEDDVRCARNFNQLCACVGLQTRGNNDLLRSIMGSKQHHLEV